MRHTELNLGRSHRAALAGLATAVIIVSTVGLPARSMAQQPGQKTFSSPEEASSALAAAAKSNDEKAMLELFGPDGKDIVSSGDETEDANGRVSFAARYQEMHRLVREPDGTTILYIGAMNWPTAIPLVAKGASWYFDTDAGKNEILFRRIGQNEISTMQVCRELVAAQKEFHSMSSDVYAQRFFSEEGQRNGLYWKAAAGEPESPIGPLVAAAVAEGYRGSPGVAPIPYHGYYYLMLTRQGKNGPGGAKSYLAKGKMTGGFAFVAFPAEYRSSGVMTFIVSQDGVVFEKDLGMKTTALAKAIRAYDPDSSWQKGQEDQEETAAEPTAR